MDRPNAWNSYKKAQLKEVDALAKDYINFISEGKTERECVKRQKLTAISHLMRLSKKAKSSSRGTKCTPSI